MRPHTDSVSTRTSIVKALERFWLALAMVGIATIGGFCVCRLPSDLGSTVALPADIAPTRDGEPLNAKAATYELFSDRAEVSTSNYLDLLAPTHEMADEDLPWSMTLITAPPANSAKMVAQKEGLNIGCRIVLDGAVNAAKTSNGPIAQTFCWVASA